MRCRLSIIFSVLVAGSASVASAQSSGVESASAGEIAAARALFHRGTASAEDGDWPAARDAFRRAYSLVPELSILFNLAAAEEQVGALVEASESYRRYIRSAGEHQGDAELVERAGVAVERITPRLGRIAVRVPGLEPNEVVHMGEVELAHAMVGVAVPVNPGMVVVRVTCGDTLCGEASVEIAEGTEGEVEVQLSRPAAIVAPSELAREIVPPVSSAPPAADLAAPIEPTGVSPWVWVGVSSAVVAAGVVAAVLLLGATPAPAGSFEEAWLLN